MPAREPRTARLTVLLATGDRSWRDRETVHAVLTHYDPQDTILIHGGANGLDEIAGEEALLLQYSEIRCFPALWKLHHNSAGPQRNSKMLKTLLAYREAHDLGALGAHSSPPSPPPRLRVISFHDDLQNGSKGTRDMVEKALRAKEKGAPITLRHYTTHSKPQRLKKRKQFT
jgi:hypothetical protein